MNWFENTRVELDEIAIAKLFCVVCMGIGLYGII